MSLVSGLLNQTIDSIYSTTKDGYGDLTRTLVYSDIPCRWQEKVNHVVGIKGEIVESRVDVWIEPSYTISESYEVVKSSEIYKVIAKEIRYDLSGNADHIRLYLV